PDHLVETELVVIEMCAHRRRRTREVAGADRLVRLLGVLRLGRVVSRLFGQVSFAELPADRIASRGYRLGRDLHAVSSHVGDEADGLAAAVDAFIKALRDLHGSVGGKAQPRGSSLLQGRSGEGRAGVAPGGLCLDGADAEG